MNALPTLAAIGGTTSACVGSTTQLTNTTAGGVWTSSDASVATVNSITGVVTGVSAGNATITYTSTNSNGCTSSVNTAVTINGLPVVAAITGTTQVCAGSTTTLASATAGGVWTSSNTATATVNASTGVVTGVAAGSTTITYTVTTNGCSASETTTVTINAIPVVQAITGITTICTGSTTALTNATAGGVWSSSNAAVALVNTSGVVTGVTSGTAIITYTVTVNGCTSSVQAFVVVNSLPVLAPIAGGTTACVGSTLTLSSSIAGGTWSSSNPSAATINTITGLVTAVASGSTTITYTLTNTNGCTSSVSSSVTINPLPVVAAITGTTSVCVGSTTALTSTTSGGVWTSSNAAIATIDAASGMVSGIAAGTTTITYTVTNSFGCVSSVSTTVTVNPLPVAPTIFGVTDVCVGSTTSLASTTTGGSWSTANSAIALINPANGVVTGVSGGSTVITYTISVAGCASTVSSQTTVNVSALPVLTAITGTNTTCVGSTTTLSNATAGGVWTSANASIATVNSITGEITGISAGSALITYTFTNANGCTNAVSTTVTVNGLPSVAAITGSSGICVGSTTALSSATAGGVWSTSNAAIATVDANGVVTGVVAGTAAISYTVTNTNGCATTVSVAVTVNPSPVVPTITGIGDICVGSTTTYTSAAAGGVWTSSNAGVATVDALTGEVTGVSAGFANIIYTLPVTGCASSVTAQQTILINAIPVLAPIAGTTTACVGSTTILSNTTAGGTWISSNTAVATVNSITGVVTGVTSGTTTITYTFTNSNGCSSSVNTAVTINGLPVVAAITGTTQVCAGSTTTLANATAGGVWTSSNTATATVNASTGVVTGVAAGSVSITYTVTNANGCSSSVTSSVTVNALPVISAISGTTQLCTGSTTVLSSATAGGVWTSSNTTVATINASTGVVTALTVGTATLSYTVTNGNGCQSVASVALVVNSVPVAPVVVVNGSSVVCPNGTVALSIPGVYSSVNWSTGETGNSIVAGPGTYFVTVANASGCDVQSAVVTITEGDVIAPVITAPADVTLNLTSGCTVNTPNIGVATATDNCSNVTVINNAPSAFNIGTTEVVWTAFDAFGNSASVVQLVTVIDNVLPTIVAPADVTVATNLECEATGVFIGQANGSDNCSFTISNNAPAVFGLGQTTVTWTITDLSGNTATATQTVTVIDNQAPIVNVTNATLSLDLTGNATLTFDLIDLNTTDNCGIANISFSNSTFTCSDIGDNKVTVTVTDNSGNISTALVTITIIGSGIDADFDGIDDACDDSVDSASIVIPSGFSPNGDGFNDVFEILGLDSYSKIDLKVYNRQGSLVYENLNYDNSWNGSYKTTSEPLPDAAYYYVLVLDNTRVEVGYVYVNRVN